MEVTENTQDNEYPKVQQELYNTDNENLQKLASLFPAAVKDGQLDIDALKEELGQFEEITAEKYELTWAGKQNAKKEARKNPLGKTLKFCPEESQYPETTENLYIEGDNLEVLKLLNKNYRGAIKMIYIDPPYNTGNDFVYNDNFSMTQEESEQTQGERDEYGERLIKNSKDSARYHTNWLNMMYPRLKTAKDLLTEDGIIFISIDDNEIENLKKLCNEVFDESNFIACIIWERAYSPVNLKKHFSENHDFILCYAKNIDGLVCNGLKRSDDANDRYKNPDNDPRGMWKSSDLSVGPIIKEKVYEIITPSGRKTMPPEGYCWRLTKERFQEFVNDNRIWFGKDGNNVPSIKRFLSEVKNTITPMTIWKYSEVGHTQDAKQKLKDIFDGASYFDYPKSVDLIKRMLELYVDNNSLILDYFSGSSTTAHACMQLNSEDGGNRKFIMIQLPEATDETSEAFKSGYKNICEIGKERIRRAGKKIKTRLNKAISNLNLEKNLKKFQILVLKF
ncbi:MAG: site-specific DNA-methyltransferase [Candidatus Gastranaerophilales bacterium]|nr:site-specific DNA-methyltransferase [Candidatus Gastranaerophilales bacterium]